MNENKKNIKYILYVGLNDKDKKIQLISTLDAYKLINNIILKYTDGATIFECDGIYKHENGTVTIEKSFKIELMFIDKINVLDIIRELKIILNQESIILQTEFLTSELI